ncbi:MAG: hypothetical protein QOE33_3428 [Acidobacteriota bacterium]|nr:hypothetical protein [Acidobacteriota bacterium]
MAGCGRKVTLSKDTGRALRDEQEVSKQNNSIVGDHVRILSVSHRDEITTA